MLLQVDIPLMRDLVLIMAVAVLVILVLNKLKLPSIIGFIISGIICGPHALHLISTETDVEMLAEIGVVLLLFTIGLEFSLGSLMKIRRAVFLGGGLQVCLTILIFGIITYIFGYDYAPIAVFIGFLVSLSSTAIVLKVLQANGKIKKVHGQIILAIMIFQDIAVVPMMLATPILSGMSEDPMMEVVWLIGKLIVIGLCLFLTGRYVIPVLLYQIAKVKSKDLFVVTTLVLCFTIAYFASLGGISIALGAFFAGLIVSESKYGYEATGNILPFKEVFTNLFFVSVGMILDINFLIHNITEVVIFTLIVMIIKAAIGGFAAAMLNVSIKDVILVALSVCQVGEFAFVLSKSGIEYGLLPIEIEQYFLSVAIITMIITPLLINFDEQIASFIINKLPIAKRLRKLGKKLNANQSIKQLEDKFQEHIIIVGFGPTGRSVAHGAKTSEIPYIIVEINPRIFKEELAKNEPIIFGDASNEEVLHHASIETAKLVVITTTDIKVTEMLLYYVKKSNPGVFVVARVRHREEAEQLKKEGADEVIIDEVEANFELVVHILDQYDVSVKDVYKFVNFIKEMA